MLSQIPRLQNLDLSKTSLDGHGLTYLKQQKFLTQLNLSGTKLADNVLVAVVFPPSLASLNVTNTAINGTGLASLCKVNRLWSLNLSASNVDDGGLQTIAAIRSLSQLDLSHCAKITDAGVRQLAKLTNLASLDLRDADGRCGTRGIGDTAQAAKAEPAGNAGDGTGRRATLVLPIAAHGPGRRSEHTAVAGVSVQQQIRRAAQREIGLNS